MTQLSCPNVVAPFAWQPGRQGLRGLGSFGLPSTAIPIGAGAGRGAAIGASQGASIGSSIVPGIGTAIGAVVGAIGGAIAGAIGKQDPEVNNLNAAVNLYRANPQALAQIANKYLVLAGWFDLEPNQVNVNGSNHPVWMQYGRMGEANFTRDLANVIYQAAQSGQITANDTAASVYANVVAPWIASFGKGQDVDHVNPGFIPTLIQGLIIDYVTGYWRNAWRARSGDFPAQFSSVPMFSLPSPAAPPVSPSGAVNPNIIAPVGSPTPVSPPPVNTPVQTMSVGPPVVPPPTPAVSTTSNIVPVGSQNNWLAPPPMLPSVVTPSQSVSMTPTVGTSVSYAPDISQNRTPYQVPQGLVFAGADPYNGSWVLQNPTGQQYVLWQGAVVPYTPMMFSPISQVPATQPIATTPSGATITQADLQSLVSQLTAQGANAQQAYASAMQSLQNSGIQATPQVQSAVQSAVASAPAPAIGSGLQGLSTTEWLLLAGGAYVLFGGHRGHAR